MCCLRNPGVFSSATLGRSDMWMSSSSRRRARGRRRGGSCASSPAAPPSLLDLGDLFAQHLSLSTADIDRATRKRLGTDLQAAASLALLDRLRLRHAAEPQPPALHARGGHSVVPRTRASPRQGAQRRAHPARPLSRLRAHCGTRVRTPSQREYSMSVDTWSIGCIFAELRPPPKPLFPGDPVRGASSGAPRPPPPPSHTASLRHLASLRPAESGRSPRPAHPRVPQRLISSSASFAASARLQRICGLAAPSCRISRRTPPFFPPPRAHLPASFALHRIALPPLSSSLSCRAPLRPDAAL